jgi:integrase
LSSACGAAAFTTTIANISGLTAKTGRFPATRRNPMDMVDKPKKNRSRERFLTHAEIRRVWQACDDWEAETLSFAEKGESRAPGGFDLLTDYPRAVKLLLLTGMRSSELGDLHWKEVTLPDPDKDDVGQIFLGTYRTKEKRVKAIALCGTAVEILRKVKAEAKETGPDDPVFGRGDGRPIKLDGVPWKEGLNLGDAARKILNRMRRGGTGFWKHELPPAKKRDIQYLLAKRIPISQIRDREHISFGKIKAIQAEMDGLQVPPEIPAEPPMDHWTIHDLRRTFRTGLSECDVDFETAERIVGHLTPATRNKTASIYDRYDYWPQKKAAMKKWEARLRTILDSDGEVPRIEPSASEQAA